MNTTYQIDPAHSSAQFVVRHMMITNVHGAFSNLQGSVAWDAANPGQSKVDVVIDATTIQTREADRDKHLRSADFLDVEKFPTITFKSTGVKAASEGELDITGDLAIHGVTKQVVLKVEGPTAEAKDPWGNLRIGASGTTKIKRSDFGLTWNAALETGGLLVGDEVKIQLEVSLIKS
ncbi:MAG TPA: YceI family protein [Terriglobia bacterium]|nr:YceI family protein [Terriglobia bacterium]